MDFQIERAESYYAQAIDALPAIDRERSGPGW
jgi:phytoene/squalene synthetase